MLNKPGTLLVVCKRQKPWHPKSDLESDGIRHVFIIDPERHTDATDDWGLAKTVNLPYGSTVMLLALEQNPESKSKRQKTMKLLWGQKYLVGNLTNRQAQAWFCVPEKWKHEYAEKP